MHCNTRTTLHMTCWLLKRLNHIIHVRTQITHTKIGQHNSKRHISPATQYSYNRCHLPGDSSQLLPVVAVHKLTFTFSAALPLLVQTPVPPSVNRWSNTVILGPLRGQKRPKWTISLWTSDQHWHPDWNINLHQQDLCVPLKVWVPPVCRTLLYVFPCCTWTCDQSGKKQANSQMLQTFWTTITCIFNYLFQK